MKQRNMFISRFIVTILAALFALYAEATCAASTETALLPAYPNDYSSCYITNTTSRGIVVSDVKVLDPHGEIYWGKYKECTCTGTGFFNCSEINGTTIPPGGTCTELDQVISETMLRCKWEFSGNSDNVRTIFFVNDVTNGTSKFIEGR